jgi:hypothetical protein
MRCGYCYQEGHNQRTCPKKTAYIKSHRDREIAAGETDSYWIREYNKRVAPSGKKKSQQVCGYCGERGHTRRKCDVLQKDREWFVKHHNEHVRVAHDYIVTSPIGIGSLFQSRRRQYNYNAGEYHYKNVMYVLTDFRLQPAIQTNGVNIVAHLSSTEDGGVYNLSLRDYVINPDYGQKWTGSMNLVHAMAQVVPSGWVQRESITFEDTAKHELFKRVGRKDEDRRQWDLDRLDRARETIARYRKHPDPAFDHVARAEGQLARHDALANRNKIFEDFKTGRAD